MLTEEGTPSLQRGAFGDTALFITRDPQKQLFNPASESKASALLGSPAQPWTELFLSFVEGAQCGVGRRLFMSPQDPKIILTFTRLI